jgi:hypothetical protein
LVDTPLQRVELGEHLVQGTDYAYTLQGWLKGINSDRLNLQVGRDAFGFSLNYHGDADYTAIDAARQASAGSVRAFGGRPCGLEDHA